jgi:hypothetical protein
MEKLLNVPYHTQKNNKILPFVTCGTTSLAGYLDYLSNISGNKFVCDDDKVFEALNSDDMLKTTRQMITKGIIDHSALDYRTDNPNTPLIDESKYTHLNNFMEILAQCGDYLTNTVYHFAIEYLNIDEIKTVINSGYPVLLSAKFTSGGHFILIAGYDDMGNWIVKDPYGNWNNNYKNFNESGNCLLYDINKIVSIFTFRKGDKLRIMRAYKS